MSNWLCGTINLRIGKIIIRTFRSFMSESIVCCTSHAMVADSLILHVCVWCGVFPVQCCNYSWHGGAVCGSNGECQGISGQVRLEEHFFSLPLGCIRHSSRYCRDGLWNHWLVYPIIHVYVNVLQSEVLNLWPWYSSNCDLTNCCMYIVKPVL